MCIRLIVHSWMPGAERFEKWVFDEVLPMIRKTGGYMTASLLEQGGREKPEILLAFADQLLAEHEKNRQLSAEVTAAAESDFYDALSMKKTAPISGLRRRNCKSGSVRFAVS